MIAWLVAGQGAEHAGMGVDLAESYSPARELWAQASEAAGKDLLELSKSGGRALLRTEYLQPALTVTALSEASLLREEGIEPEMVLGHSAGEIGALALAGSMTYEAACELSARRGRIMAGAARARPGGMAAVRGSDARQQEVIMQGSAAGAALFPAGQTTADTYLISGDRAALRAASSAAGVSLLPVSGAWHSPLMEEAAAELRPVATSIIVDADGSTDWVSNETAARGPADAAGIVELLVAQLTRPMNLHRSIELLLEEGATEIVVLGPYKALSHIVNRHLERRATARVHGASSFTELRGLVKELS